MIIRKSTTDDQAIIKHIYDKAIDQMEKNGNPHQWPKGYITNEIVKNDIDAGYSYVLEFDEKVVGVFVFFVGDEPTYQIIDGKWLNDEPYGVIHRVASDGTHKGLMDLVLNYCFRQINNIRIDTHDDNAIMKYLLEKNGFEYCGIIEVSNGKRSAYQKKI